MNDWSRRVAALRHVGTIARAPMRERDPRSLDFDASRRFIAWSLGWEDGGVGFGDLRDGRVLLEDAAHHTLKVFPLNHAFASADHETKRLVVFRIDEGGRVQREQSAPLGALSVESIAPGGDRVFVRGEGFSDLVAWPSFERIARFRGWGTEIDWEARRVMRRLPESGAPERLQILDFDGEEITTLPIAGYGSLRRLAPGVWARYGTGLRVVDVLDGRDLSVFIASPGRISAPSLSADRKRLRFVVRGKPRRIDVDLGAMSASVGKEIARAVRVAGTDDALFHPHADLVAEHRAKQGWTIRELDGTPVLSLATSVPRTWSEDGEVLLAVHHGFIHVWQ